MLSPFLLIGVGGSGGKTLRAVRQKLDMYLRLQGWTEGIPAAWQFLHYDTPIVQDGNEFPAPFLPQECYVGLAAAHSNFQNIITAIEAPLNKDFRDEALAQLPNPKEVAVPVSKGAGQYRAVGRAVALSRLKQIGEAAKLAMARAKAPDSLAKLAQLSELLGGDPAQGRDDQPTLLVVSSVSGGSGAGQYLDVVDAVKAQFASDSSKWAQDSYGILYAPDVFDGLSGAAGISSNALATISETLNGNWNHNVDNSVQALFAAQGISLETNEPHARVGVRYPLIVGRQGARTSFKGQTDIYLSIASTISAWMTQEHFQGQIEAYIRTNMDVQSDSVMIQSKFRGNAATNKAPLGAIGFGRVTLGRQEFLEYSKERFAKSSIDRLLRAHVLDAGDPLFKHKSNDAYIKESIDNQLVRFFLESGFAEETESNNQVLDAMRDEADLERNRERFKIQVSESLRDAVDPKKGGLEAAQWIDRFEHARAQLINSFRDDDARERARRFATWLAEAPELLFATVSRYVVEYGMPVTAGLLEELAISVGTAADELRRESDRYYDYVSHLNSYLSNDLSAAGANAIIRPGSDHFNVALDRVGDSYTWEVEAELRGEVAELLKEAQRGLIKPLAVFVKEVSEALRGRAEADRNPDGRENDFSKWPGADSREVPAKYRPSSNERMLVEVEEFPDEFIRLVTATREDSNSAESPMKAVLRDVITKRRVGEEEVDVSLVRFRSDSKWIPTATVGSSARLVAQKAFFEMPAEIDDYLQMAQQWMQIPGRPFSGYLNETIGDFLDSKNASPTEFARRKDKFIAQLRGALAASGPLVKINATLLNKLHERAVGEHDTVMVSPIPLTPAADLYEATKQVFMEELGDDEAKAAGRFSEKSAQSIEIMQALGFGVLPIVMDSLMQPVASDWSRVNASESGRSGWWQWKRARLLAEAVPMDREAFLSLLSGWYIARGFNLLEAEKNATLGPKLSVKDASGKKLDFPHPLLYSGKLQPIDYVGAMVESSIIVQALANASNSLEPLQPYERLIELGGPSKSLSDEVSDWITSGGSFDATDQRSIASQVPVTAEYTVRSDKLIDFLDGALKMLAVDLPRHRESSTIYDMPIVWELMPDIEEAIEQTKSKVRGFLPQVDQW